MIARTLRVYAVPVEVGGSRCHNHRPLKPFIRFCTPEFPEIGKKYARLAYVSYFFPVLEDASDGNCYLCDPTSSNRAYALPQMASRMPDFPPPPPQQAAGILEEFAHESASDILMEVKKQDFGRAINEDNAYITDDPYMSPVIDGHKWKINET
jgi:hypothetical protein